MNKNRIEAFSDGIRSRPNSRANNMFGLLFRPNGKIK